MTGLHDIEVAGLTLRFERSGTTQSFTTTARKVAIHDEVIYDTADGRLIARIDHQTTGRTLYRPPDRRSQVWFDILTITPAGEA